MTKTEERARAFMRRTRENSDHKKRVDLLHGAGEAGGEGPVA